LTINKIIYRWLHGEDFDIRSEFDNFSRQLHEEEESSSDEVSAGGNKNVDKKNRKYKSRFVWVLKALFNVFLNFYSRTFMKAVILSFTLATIQRMSGAGAIVQFTAKLFQISGSSVEPITASIITGIFQLAGSGVAIFLIDNVGRRKLLLVSSTVVVVCLSSLTIYFYYLTRGININMKRICDIGTCL